MKFQVNQLELSNALSIVSKAASTKNILYANGIYFEARNNKLRLITNDSTLSIDTHIDAEVEEDGVIVIPKTVILDLIKKLPNTKITFTKDINANLIHLSVQGKKYNLSTYDDSDFKMMNFEEEGRILLEKEKFINLINKTEFAVLKDDSRPILTGILFDIHEKELNVVAIDGYRMAHKQSSIQSNSQIKLVIPSKSLKDAKSILSQSNSESQLVISYNKTYAKIQIDDIILITTLLSGDFVNYKQFVPKNHSTQMEISTVELKEAVERIHLVAKESKNIVIKLTIKDDILEIASTSEIGSASEKINIKLIGNDLTIGLNPQYLLDVLKVIDSEFIVIHFTTEVAPCIIHEKNDDSFTCLLLPLRISK